MPRRPTSLLLACTLVGVAPACVGELGGAGGEPGERALLRRDVVLAGETPRLASGACVDLLAGERLLDASAEGDAWIGGPLGLRVIEIDGTERPAVTLRAGEASWALGLSDTDAVAGAGGAIFRIDGGEVVPIDLPAELGTPELACGDPLGHGSFALVSDAGLFARGAGLWYRWQIGGSPMRPRAGLAEASGACAGAEERLFLAQDDGVVAVAEDGSGAYFLDLLEAPGELSRQGELVAGIAGGELRIRPSADAPYEHVGIDLGAVRAVSVGGGRVWALAGESVVRRDRDGTFERIDVEMRDLDPSRAAIVADETGGAWVVQDGASGATRICHRATEEPLRVRGIVPHERVDGPRTLRVIAGESTRASALEVRIDGEVAHEASAPIAGTWEIPAVDLGGPGWHRLELVASTPDGEVRRSLDAHVIDTTPPSFEEDIAPIFEAHCAGCHAASGPQTPLHTLDAWRALGHRMLQRMARGEMPPPPAPSVPASDIDTLQRWLEGGMLP